MVSFLGFFNKENDRFLVFKYMPNGDLLSLLRKQGKMFSTDDLVTMAFGATNGMHYLEEKGLIHRDLAARYIK